MSDIRPEHIEWCRELFRTLNDGGSWAVPRSGLILIKQGSEFVLDEACLVPDPNSDPRVLDGELAHTDLPLRQMSEYQLEDFETIKRHFEAAGITVRRE